jgi:hypothetical protein
MGYRPRRTETRIRITGARGKALNPKIRVKLWDWEMLMVCPEAIFKCVYGFLLVIIRKIKC